MKYSFDPKDRLAALLYTAGVASILFFAIPYLFVFSATAPEGAGRSDENPKTISNDPTLPNYDIRTAKNEDAVESLLRFRAEAGKNASGIADERDRIVRGEEELRAEVDSLKVEYNPEMPVPEVISPDVWKNRMENLAGPTGRGRAETLRAFVKRYENLIGVTGAQADKLKVVADYMNPSGNMGFAQLEQRIDGIPVFRGEVKAGFRKDGSLVRVINNLAPGLEYDSLSADFGDPLSAVKSAARHIDYQLKKPDVTRNEPASDELKIVFGDGDWATTAEKMYFPTEIGVVRPAWRVLIWQPVNAYYVIVDAETGTMLWRKNITEDQTQTATFDVYASPNAFINAADSPAPFTPGPVDPTMGTQAPVIARSLITRIGNEGSDSANTNGWINDGNNSTDGNALEAGIDRDGINGVDAPVMGDTPCPGTGCRVFTSTWNPPPGNPAPGDAPLTTQAQRGAVIQMFYVMNLYHDALYRLGFTEQAFNFQHDNFGRGGNGGDRVSAEGQDSSGTNNANFSTPSDGGRGRMQMYLWTGPNPDYDGTADADIIIHEVTHGTSNRLHGNSSGLGSNMSRGMGEGWGDFYGHVLLSAPTDPINGIYTTGGYATYLGAGGTFTGNYYYGIRRFPKAVMAFTGGPGNLPHNPLTFANINQGNCSSFSSAFPRGPFGSSTCDQVHAAGEVWSSALWEVRSLMVSRLGWAAGSQRVLQVVTDGMKMAPLNPTFLQERDSIIAAAAAASASPETSADVQDVWEGFRIRGMGFSAEIVSTSPANVIEAFDLPNAVIADTGFAVSDSPGDNDGFPEPGENLSVSVPIYNGTGATITGVTVSLNGGPATSYGDVADGATVLRQIPFSIPGGTACGSFTVLTITINGSVGQRIETRAIIVGQPDPPATENFDGVSAPALPSGWTTSQTGPGVAFVTQTASADSAPNSAFTPNTGAAGGNAGATLESVAYAINAEAGVVSFRNSYNTESGWDGAVLEISINGAPFQDILGAGGEFIEGGYNGVLGVNTNPLDGRAAWTGNSGGYITSSARLPAAAAGQSVKFRWRFGEDNNTFSVGWNVDSIAVTSDYTCNVVPGSGARFDYDGDGKTDVSVFRPNPSSVLENASPEGSSSQWWLLNSGTSSALGLTFGLPSDVLTPADFTGDGKTDVAFFRPSTGQWFVLRSEDFTFFAFPFGAAGDLPAPGDFDGDGRADPAVYRPSEGTWYILRSSDSGVTAIPFGVAEDKPTVADFDGDGMDDVAVYRPSVNQWWQLRSTAGVIGIQFGAAGDKTVVGDYTGDGKADVAFYRPSTGEWYVIRSEDFSFFAFPWGAPGDVPAPGDYDGDGTADAAVFRPGDATWYLLRSTDGFQAVPFGVSSDIPTPSAYVQ